jgi:hypothetical protein
MQVKSEQANAHLADPQKMHCAESLRTLRCTRIIERFPQDLQSMSVLLERALNAKATTQNLMCADESSHGGIEGIVCSKASGQILEIKREGENRVPQIADLKCAYEIAGKLACLAARTSRSPDINNVERRQRDGIEISGICMRLIITGSIRCQCPFDSTRISTEDHLLRIMYVALRA